MKEGRMKGQGFITFPTEEAAEKALNDTNGYVLNGKPMAVVSFLVNVKKWVIGYGCWMPFITIFLLYFNSMLNKFAKFS